MLVDALLLLLMVVTAVWTVLTRPLINAAIGLALVSIVLTILIFRLDCPWAAVFELSVCAGLITVVFISAISLMKPASEEEETAEGKDRLKRYIPLPIILLASGIILSVLRVHLGFDPVPPTTVQDVREVLWNDKIFDIIGQLLIILAGVFGVVVLIKERKSND